MGFINHDAPQLFEKEFPDGSRFRCSESFVRKYLSTLGWSERTSTRPAQKLPENYEQILADLFLRQAYITRDHGIIPQLRVNTDKHNFITRWVESVRGIRQPRSRSQPWGWKRSVPSRWYLHHLPAASFSPFRPFSSVKLQNPALNTAHATTIARFYWASNSSHHAPKHTGPRRLPWCSLSPTSLPHISIVKRRSSAYLTRSVRCG